MAGDDACSHTLGAMSSSAASSRADGPVSAAANATGSSPADRSDEQSAAATTPSRAAVEVPTTSSPRMGLSLVAAPGDRVYPGGGLGILAPGRGHVTRCFFALLLMLLVSAAPALAHSEEPKSHGPDTTALDKRGRTPAATYSVDNHAAWSASQWDGQTFTSDQPDTTTDPTVHAIYLYPSNKPSRFSQFAAMFQADARQANDLIYNLYGRGV